MIYLLGLCKKSEDFISLNGVLDFIYVTCEILAVYLAIITFPTHEANMYSNSLKGFWSVLIVLSVFTGKWYYGFYSGALVAILNSSLSLFYFEIEKEFRHAGLDLQKIDPFFQIFIWSFYYFLQGALISFPFYLFKQQQSMALNVRTEHIVAGPYYELSLKDGSHIMGDYLIIKVSSSKDLIGADFVSIKRDSSGKSQGALIIGDVIGHGLNRSPGAIICMAAFKSSESSDPDCIQKTVNRVLLNLDKTDGGKAICLSVRLLPEGIIEYSGKIDSIIHVSHEGKTSVSLHCKGEILGVSESLIITETSKIQLKDGDSIYLKTDGTEDSEDDRTVIIITKLSPQEMEIARQLALN